MNELLIGLVAALLATNQVTAVSNVVARTTGIALPVVDPADPTEQEYRKLLEADDAAQTEVDRWIQENNAFKTAQEGADFAGITLNARVEQRFAPVRKAYEDFLLRHPHHVRARLAFGSFLNDQGLEVEAVEQWEKARELDPKNPACWNNLADYYSHRGPVRKAFEYVAKAIELNPREPVYQQNLALLVFLFRKDAMELLQLADEQHVFRRALELYRKAQDLDPQNFALATDIAQVYYYLKPPPAADPAAASRLVDEALEAWTAAEKLATTDVERQGVAIHMARVCVSHARWEAARQQLARVTHPNLEELRKRVTRNLEEKERAARDPAASPPPAPKAAD